jgi:hypothetical protein
MIIHFIVHTPCKEIKTKILLFVCQYPQYLYFYPSITSINMSNQTRKIIRIVSIFIVLVVVFIQLDILNINWAPLNENKIWLLIIAYFMLLITARG